MEDYPHCPGVNDDGLNTKARLTTRFIYNQQLLDNLKLDGGPKLIKLCTSFTNHVVPVLRKSFEDAMQHYNEMESA